VAATAIAIVIATDSAAVAAIAIAIATDSDSVTAAGRRFRSSYVAAASVHCNDLLK